MGYGGQSTWLRTTTQITDTELPRRSASGAKAGGRRRVDLALPAGTPENVPALT